jgi:hypothetical protein
MGGGGVIILNVQPTKCDFWWHDPFPGPPTLLRLVQLLDGEVGEHGGDAFINFPFSLQLSRLDLRPGWTEDKEYEDILEVMTTCRLHRHHQMRIIKAHFKLQGPSPSVSGVL